MVPTLLHDLLLALRAAAAGVISAAASGSLALPEELARRPEERVGRAEDMVRVVFLLLCSCFLPLRTPLAL